MADDLPPGYTVETPGDDLPPGYTAVSAPTGTQTGSIVRGIPILGPLLDRGVAAVAAAPAAVLPGAGYKAMYNKMIGGQDRYEKENPVASTIGQTAGSLISTVPVARAIPAAFGGATVPGQMAAGAAIGGTDAAVRSGGDVDAIKTGALIGGAAPVLGSILAPAGQGIAAATRWAADKTPGVKNVIARKVAPIPGKEILDATDTGYKTLGQHVKYDPASIGDLGNLAKRDIYTGAVGTRESAKKAHGIIDDMANLPPNPAALHNTRKQLQKLINEDPGGPEGQSALIARNLIDNFLDAPPASAVVSSRFNAQQLGERLKLLNKDWQAGLTSKEWRERLAKAKVDAETSWGPSFLAEGQATRKQAKNYLTSDAAKFLTPEAREAVNKVVKSQSLGETGMRLATGLTGTQRPSVMTGIAGLLAGGGAALGNPLAAIGATVAGVGSAAGGSALARRAAEKADMAIRASSPYAQSLMRRQVYQPQISGAPYTPWQPSIGARAHRDEIARLLALQAQREATEK